MSKAIVKKEQPTDLIKLPDKKIDIADALKLRLRNKLTFQAIGDKYGYTAGGVYRALKPYLDMIQSPDVIRAYEENKVDILSGIHVKLLSQLVNEDKLKDASLNNAAYAATAVHNMLRLEKDLSTANIAEHMTFNVVTHEAAAARDKAQAAQFNQGNETEDQAQPDTQEE